jgi:hypothetical protein
MLTNYKQREIVSVSWCGKWSCSIDETWSSSNELHPWNKEPNTFADYQMRKEARWSRSHKESKWGHDSQRETKRMRHWLLKGQSQRTNREPSLIMMMTNMICCISIITYYVSKKDCRELSLRSDHHANMLMVVIVVSFSGSWLFLTPIFLSIPYKREVVVSGGDSRSLLVSPAWEKVYFSFPSVKHLISQKDLSKAIWRLQNIQCSHADPGKKTRRLEALRGSLSSSLQSIRGERDKSSRFHESTAVLLVVHSCFAGKKKHRSRYRCVSQDSVLTVSSRIFSGDFLLLHLMPLHFSSGKIRGTCSIKSTCSTHSL